MGGSSFLFHLAGARLGNNLASQPEAQGQIISEGAPNKIQNPTQKRHLEKSKISILEVVTKNCYLTGFGSSWEKALHGKSKILIKGDVSKFRYFQHACQSGPKINHSRSIHLSALPKHLGDWCLFGIVSFITNIFHKGGIIHKTETKKGHKNRSDSDCDA